MTSLFVEQPNVRLKLAAALCKTVLKLSSPNSTSIVVTVLKECILLRDGFLSLPEIFALTDIENIISEVCSMR